MSQKPILPNPHQPLGYDVQRESAHEFHRLQRHLLALTAVGIVLPGEGDPIVLELDQTTIAQGDPVRVPGQVFRDSSLISTTDLTQASVPLMVNCVFWRSRAGRDEIPENESLSILLGPGVLGSSS